MENHDIACEKLLYPNKIVEKKPTAKGIYISVGEYSTGKEVWKVFDLTRDGQNLAAIMTICMTLSVIC